MRPPSLGLLVAAGAAILLFALGARAATVQATATTYTDASQPTYGDAESHTLVPAYELVDVTANQIHMPWGDTAAVVLSGWGGVDLANDTGTSGPGADLNLLYVEGGAFRHALTFRLGRQFVMNGVARMTQLDGANLQYVVHHIGLQAYGGAIVTPRFAEPLATTMAGGRLFWNPTLETEIGASYAQIFDHALSVRQEVGLDGRAVLLHRLVLDASAFYDLAAARIAEAVGDASWRFGRLVTLGARYQRTAPDLFLPPNSIWTVFADDERRDSVGGFAIVTPAEHWSIWLEGLGILGSNGNGFETTGRVSWTQRFYSIGLDVHTLSYDADGHLTPRLYAVWRPGDKLTLSGDLEETWLQHPMNGVTHVFNASGTAAWTFVPSWQLALAVLGGDTPFLSQDVEVLGRLQWAPTFGGQR